MSDVVIFGCVLAALLAVPTFVLLWNKANYWHERRKKELLVLMHMNLDLDERREKQSQRRAGWR